MPEQDNAWEDLGYRRDHIVADQHYHLPKRADIEKIKIEYLSGMMKDRTCWIRKDIAEDLINRHIARRVE